MQGTRYHYRTNRNLVSAATEIETGFRSGHDVELVNAQSLLVKTRNDAKASFADLNRAMGNRGPRGLCARKRPGRREADKGIAATLLSDSLSHPELQRAKEQTASAEAKARAMKRQYLPTVSAIASGGSYDTFDSSRADVPTGGWWAAGALGLDATFHRLHDRESGHARQVRSRPLRKP